ncbi:MptD family putative ECF transporter S component [Lysinibacillus macroides]|uniref:MptD family putative ECF transporter S component n=1 Tax=Lysinibacillus macroides TaxID=33935 RepID=UPI0039952E26
MLPVLVGIVGGVPFILFLAKTERFGMITLSGIICGLIMMSMGGNGIYPLLTGMVCGLFADILFIKLKSSSFSMSLSYAAFSLRRFYDTAQKCILFIQSSNKNGLAKYKLNYSSR